MREREGTERQKQADVRIPGFQPRGAEQTDGVWVLGRRLKERPKVHVQHPQLKVPCAAVVFVRKKHRQGEWSGEKGTERRESRTGFRASLNPGSPRHAPEER